MTWFDGDTVFGIAMPLVLGALVAFGLVARGVLSLYRTELEAVRQRANRIQDENEEKDKTIKEISGKLADALRAPGAVQPIAEAVHEHDRRAAERHQALIAAMADERNAMVRALGSQTEAIIALTKTINGRAA